MSVKFLQPFYDGDEVIVRGRAEESAQGVTFRLDAVRGDGTVCAAATAEVDRVDQQPPPQVIARLEADLPEDSQRPEASFERLAAGTVLGTIVEEVDTEAHRMLLEQIDERLPYYRGVRAVAHPCYLLGLSNQIFARNFKLGPWIHSASEVTNWSTVQLGERITIKALVANSYERRGHEFAVLEVTVAARDRLVQQVRHTAIFRLRPE
jgi:hypothetical protein